MPTGTLELCEIAVLLGDVLGVVLVELENVLRDLIAELGDNKGTEDVLAETVDFVATPASTAFVPQVALRADVHAVLSASVFDFA